MKNVLSKIGSFIINLIEGAVGIISVAVIYAFIFESDNQDHDVGLGIFVLLIWLAVLLIPNLFIKFVNKFRIKDVMIFQFVPFVLGAVLYPMLSYLLEK